MGFLDTIIGTPVSRLKLNELRAEEMRLENHISLVEKKMAKVEKEKQDLFKQGVGAPVIKKNILIEKIKRLDMGAQLQYKGFATMSKQLMFISNLVIIKQYEKELKQSPIWAKITNIDPSNFESSLINVNLKGKSYDEVLNNLNSVFEISLTESSLEQSTDETSKAIINTWNQVETGAINVEDAKNVVSMDKQLENKDTEVS